MRRVFGCCCSARGCAMRRLWCARKSSTAFLPLSTARSSCSPTSRRRCGLASFLPPGRRIPRVGARCPIERRLILSRSIAMRRRIRPTPRFDRHVADIRARAGSQFDAILQQTGMAVDQLRREVRDDLRIEAYLQQRFGGVCRPKKRFCRYYRDRPAEFTQNGSVRSFDDAHDAARASSGRGAPGRDDSRLGGRPSPARQRQRAAEITSDRGRNRRRQRAAADRRPGPLRAGVCVAPKSSCSRFTPPRHASAPGRELQRLPVLVHRRPVRTCGRSRAASVSVRPARDSRMRAAGPAPSAARR